MTRRPALALALALLAAPALAQDDPGWTFTVGSGDRYESVSTVDIRQELGSRSARSQVTMTLRWAQRVIAVNAHGTATLEVRFERVKFSGTNLKGSKLAFDSTDADQLAKAKLDPKYKAFASLLDGPQTLKVSRKGKVRSVKGATKGAAYDSSGDWQTVWLQFPRTAVGPNETWTSSYMSYDAQGNLKMTNRHTLLAKTESAWTVSTKMSGEAEIYKPAELQSANVSVTRAEGEQSQVVEPGKGRLKTLSNKFQLDFALRWRRGRARLHMQQTTISRTRVKWLGAAKPRPKPVDPDEAKIALLLKKLGTQSPSKKSDPKGWKEARQVRKRAALDLQALGAKALPALKEASQDATNKTLRQWAAYVIKKIEAAKQGGE